MKSILSVAATLFATTSLAELMTPEKVVADIDSVNLERNLWHLNHIAKENGGNRAFGFPGYEASSDYVLERVQKRFAKHFDSWTQNFDYAFETTREISVTGPDGEDVAVLSLIYNNATPLPGGITASLIDTPVDETGEIGSGCTEEQWAGIDATGKIALVKRGVCAIYEKLLLAKAHGALGVILWNQASGIPTAATLGAEHLGLIPPVGVIQMEVGLAWKARLAAGEDLVVNLLVDSIHDVRTSWNVFAETKEGDPNNVIMLGAHLDSVQAGPGINDDGSGTTALLEIASSIKKYKGFKNKIRLAWWGNEEGGLAGSLFYTSNLTEVEADKIRFYFNYDMIGSIEPIYEVYRDDGNVGSEIGSQILYDYLVAAGKPAEYGAFGTSSDYVGFREIGIPSSGLFTGAGAPEDPCYHLACDTTDNINSEALLINAQAAGAAAAEFALSLGDLPARSKTTINPRNRKQIRAEMTKWKRAAETAERGQGHTCSHKANNVV